MRTDSQPPAHGEFQTPLPDANELLSELQELREERESFFWRIEEFNTEIDWKKDLICELEMTILQLKDENRTLSSLLTQEHSVSLTIHTVCSHLEALEKEVYGIKAVSTDTASTVEAIQHAVVMEDREHNLLKHHWAEFETADSYTWCMFIRLFSRSCWHSSDEDRSRTSTGYFFSHSSDPYTLWAISEFSYKTGDFFNSWPLNQYYLWFLVRIGF